MRSNSFDTQEVRKIGRKKAGESRGFPILCMGIIDVFRMEGKECEDQERLKMWRKKSAFRRLIRVDSMYVYHYILSFEQDFALEQRSTLNSGCCS